MYQKQMHETGMNSTEMTSTRTQQNTLSNTAATYLDREYTNETAKLHRNLDH
jgi:hypothetical protein